MAAQNTTPDRTRWYRRINWEGVSAIAALLTLVAAVFWSGRQTQEAREATQLQLLTELNSQLNESFAQLGRHEPEVINLWSGERKHLTLQARLDLDRAFAYMEYLSWLANGEYITLPRARELWGEAMACRYEHILVASRAPERRALIAKQYPHLTRFIVPFRPCDE